MRRSFRVPGAPNLKCIKPFPPGDAATAVTLTFVVDGKTVEKTIPFAWANLATHAAEIKALHDSVTASSARV